MFLLFAAVAMIVYTVAGDSRSAVQLFIVATPLATFAYALATRRLPRSRPWFLSVGGLIVLLIGQLSMPGWLDGHLGQAEGTASELTLSASHGLFLMGTAIALRRRLASDASGLLDAALLGLCAGGPLWVWGVQPHLTDAATPLGLLLLMIDVFAISGVIGCLIRMGASRGPGQDTILYLTLTAILTQTALVTGWTEPLLLAFLTIAAAPIQRGALEVTEPLPSAGAPMLGRGHLSWLAVALSVNPLLTAVQIMRGNEAASLMLPVGTLLIVPLVLLRFHRLAVQREQAERTLEHQATHDELTGLRNRRHMMTSIDRALTGPAGVTVLLCDLDGFKPINDKYGHLAGDEALKVVAARLCAVTRPGDVVGRLGGDEFLVVCEGVDASELAQRIRETLRLPMALSTGVVTIGVTVGAASAEPGCGIDRETLIGTADAAMYAGKKARAA
ncbi:diguanylate cyclase (GGDEF)-like protein [Actinoplanes lutulentus]|uniref:Diguanylate cyclase (GGDEF)-like protein n=2 Tax=Actinoplanes lutulentus TaxID=1287878 RepID=A0A327YYD9_9ACTN|nr:diguanylate cyclase (GGDEF)-like protein [Actinoplanes lutulentus]